jgi:hypothetical protein
MHKADPIDTRKNFTCLQAHQISHSHSVLFLGDLKRNTVSPFSIRKTFIQNFQSVPKIERTKESRIKIYEQNVAESFHTIPDTNYIAQICCATENANTALKQIIIQNKNRIHSLLWQHKTIGFSVTAQFLPHSFYRFIFWS